jgi:hypothetical protein
MAVKEPVPVGVTVCEPPGGLVVFVTTTLFI